MFYHLLAVGSLESFLIYPHLRSSIYRMGFRQLPYMILEIIKYDCIVKFLVCNSSVNDRSYLGPLDHTITIHVYK